MYRRAVTQSTIVWAGVSARDRLMFIVHIIISMIHSASAVERIIHSCVFITFCVCSDFAFGFLSFSTTFFFSRMDFYEWQSPDWTHFPLHRNGIIISSEFHAREMIKRLQVQHAEQKRKIQNEMNRNTSNRWKLKDDGDGWIDDPVDVRRSGRKTGDFYRRRKTTKKTPQREGEQESWTLQFNAFCAKRKK